MTDVVLLGIAVAFFAVTAAYVRGCERLIGTDDARSPDER